MDFSMLPANGIEFAGWTWEQIKPYYDDLIGREIGEGDVEAWLKDWSRLASLIDEVGYRLQIATDQDTTSKEAEARFGRFNIEIRPRAAEAGQKLKQKLLASKFEPAGFEVPLAKMRWETEIFSEKNLPLEAESLRLVAEYQKIKAGMRAEWDGKSLNYNEIFPYLESSDRAVREGVWRARLKAWSEIKEPIDAIWMQMLRLRDQMAKNAGLGSFRDYMWKKYLRLDYTPEDTQRLRDAVEEAVVPANKRIYERRARRLGLDTFKHWDTEADQFKRAPLRPFQTTEELEAKMSGVFRRVDPELGDFFDIMRREKLIDMENRPGKAPGGFNLPFESIGKPFIYGIAVGLQRDLETLLHEGGHAFHTFEMAHLPYLQQRGEVGVPAEFAEVASMGMEFLGMRFAAAKGGGFYSEEELARAQIRHLEDSLLLWPYLVIVDQHQQWLYTHIETAMDIDASDAHWIDLWNRFMQGIDFSGVEQHIPLRWRIQTHFFDTPLYYVEYAIALLGAFQVWANSLRDHQSAVAQYRAALRLGGSKRLPELYRAAGIKLAFDIETVREAVNLIEEQLAVLETRL